MRANRKKNDGKGGPKGRKKKPSAETTAPMPWGLDFSRSSPSMPMLKRRRLWCERRSRAKSPLWRPTGDPSSNVRSRTSTAQAMIPLRFITGTPRRWRDLRPSCEIRDRLTRNFLAPNVTVLHLEPLSRHDGSSINSVGKKETHIGCGGRPISSSADGHGVEKGQRFLLEWPIEALCPCGRRCGALPRCPSTNTGRLKSRKMQAVENQASEIPESIPLK